MPEKVAASSQSCAVKRIASNTRVSGTFGALIDDPSNRRRKRARIFGTVLHALDKGMYQVQFDDGTCQDVYANRLRVESRFSSLPPDVIPPRMQDDPQRPPQGEAAMDAEEEAIQENLQDQAEEEHLPVETPEEDELEQEQENQAEDEPEENVSDEHGRMPGQIEQEQAVDAQPDYQQRKRTAKEKVQALLGQKILVKHKRQQMEWTVVDNWEPQLPELVDVKPLGLIEFCAADYTSAEVLAHLFLHLAFVDWRVTLQKMNAAIRADNEKRKGRVKPFRDDEFLVALGLLIGSVEYGTRGKELWVTSSHKDGGIEGEVEKWESFVCHPNFDQHMRAYRFRDFRKYFPLSYVDETKKGSDDWFSFSPAVEEFNELRAKRVNAHVWKTADESMSSYRPRTTKLGGLPNISLVMQKPEPLGKFFVCFFGFIPDLFLTSCYYFSFLRKVLSSSVQPAQRQAACCIWKYKEERRA